MTTYLLNEPRPAWGAYWERALPFDVYLTSVERNRDFWHSVHRLARVPDELAARAAAVPGRWRLLALTEDWCGDAVNTLPLVARLAERVPAWEMRLLGRDDNPLLMDAHLSGVARSIPVVVALDETLVEHGWWGPRPRQLQEWIAGEGLQLPKEERYPRVRGWYARDGGRSTIEEVVALVERAAAGRGAEPALSHGAA